MNTNAADQYTGKMYFLIEMDHVKSGAVPTKETRREFIEGTILPTLALAERYAAEGKILAGGPVAGSVALRFIVETDSPQSLDHLLLSLPLWRISETRVTPLIAFGDRHAEVQAILQGLATDPIIDKAFGK